MVIQSVGYHHPHDRNFVIDRPYGVASWLFLLVKTPALFRINGRESVCRRNSFIIFTEGVPQYYRASGEEYIDDWFHFEVDDVDRELFRALEIPLNTLTRLENINDISEIIKNISYEFCDENPFLTDITDMYLKILFLKLGDIIGGRVSVQAGCYQQMLALRREIYNTPHIRRSVDEMAAEFSMSRSSFQHNYKKIFGVSVTDEVNSARMKRAQDLLFTTDMTLAEIALQCGYNDEAYFIRRFKLHRGETPTEYRKRLYDQENKEDKQ